MKRRNALKTMVWATGAAVALPYYCTPPVEPMVYTNLPIDMADRDLIDLISNLILPQDPEAFPTEEPRQQFILTMVNDVFDPEQIADYVYGMQQFRAHVTATYEVPFETLDQEDQLACIGKVIDCGDEMSFFVSSIKSLSLRHFRTSENYMTQFLNFEFMPGRYNGCVPVQTI